MPAGAQEEFERLLSLTNNVVTTVDVELIQWIHLKPE